MWRGGWEINRVISFPDQLLHLWCWKSKLHIYMEKHRAQEAPWPSCFPARPGDTSTHSSSHNSSSTERSFVVVHCSLQGPFTCAKNGKPRGKKRQCEHLAPISRKSEVMMATSHTHSLKRNMSFCHFCHAQAFGSWVRRGASHSLHEANTDLRLSGSNFLRAMLDLQ